MYYGVTGKSKDLLFNYLTERQQYVQICDYMSLKQLVMAGVRQGSVLEPLLFNNFINGVIHFILYVDDTTLNSTLDYHGTTTDEIKSSIINELQKIFKWLDVNRLCLNIAKSKFMLFYMPQKITPNLRKMLKLNFAKPELDVFPLLMFSPFNQKFISDFKSTVKEILEFFQQKIDLNEKLDVDQPSNYMQVIISVIIFIISE